MDEEEGDLLRGCVVIVVVCFSFSFAVLVFPFNQPVRILGRPCVEVEEGGGAATTGVAEGWSGEGTTIVQMFTRTSSLHQTWEKCE